MWCPRILIVSSKLQQSSCQHFPIASPNQLSVHRNISAHTYSDSAHQFTQWNISQNHTVGTSVHKSVEHQCTISPWVHQVWCVLNFMTNNDEAISLPGPKLIYKIDQLRQWPRPEWVTTLTIKYQKGVLWARVFLGVCDLYIYIYFFFPIGIVKHRLTVFLPHSFHLCTCLPSILAKCFGCILWYLLSFRTPTKPKKPEEKQKILGEVWVSVRALVFCFFCFCVFLVFSRFVCFFGFLDVFRFFCLWFGCQSRWAEYR